MWIGATSGEDKYYLAGYDPYLAENGMRGVLILVRKGIKVKRAQVLSPDILRIDIEIGPNKLTIVGVYGTSSHDDPDFFINLRGHLADIDTDEVAVLGDLNTTLCPVKDRLNYQSDRHWKSRAVINEWIESGDFVDAYRSLNPEGISMTWKQRGAPATARLDYILLSNKLAGKLKYCKTIHCPAQLSDHCGVEAEITMDRSPPGPGTFRAIPNIQKDPSYNRSVKFLIREELINLSNTTPEEKTAEHALNLELFQSRNQDLFTKTEIKKNSAAITKKMMTYDRLIGAGLSIATNMALDYILCKVKNATKIYQRKLKAEENDALEDLQKQIDEAKDDEDKTEEEISILEDEHWKILKRVCEREAAKLKTFQLLQDEKPSKGMLALEKKLAGYTNVTMLYGPDEEHTSPTAGGSLDRAANPRRKILTDPKEVRDFMRKHMVKIYRKQDNLTPEAEQVESFLRGTNDDAVLKELQNRKLDARQRNELEGKILKSELAHQLFEHMKNNSAPGIDGFTVAWLKAFWHDLGDLCTHAINDCYDKNQLSPTLSQAIMKILQKGDKDPLEAGNYRPISLLSVFYKLASGVMTRRLQKVIEKVIGVQQKAYSQERNIGSVLLNLMNLMDEANKKKINCLILSIDFKKAFDSIEHSFINSCLTLLNFGDDFKKWVQLFFKNRETYLLLDGHMGEKITLEQGVPQGDVLSPYIFNIAVEFLLLKITHTNTIEGVKFARWEYRAETYADDTTIFIKRSEDNLRNLVKIITDFAKISGLHANLDKTSVTPIGGIFSIEKEDQLCQDLGLKWVRKFTLLGITFDSKLEELQENFDEKILKTKSLMEKWKRRKLTVSGRVSITKCLLLSNFVYLLTILDTSSTKICEDLQTLLDDFIRGDTKKPWASANYLHSDKPSGGLGFFNIATFVKGLKLTWMKRYILGTKDTWSTILDHRFNIMDRETVTMIGDLKIKELAEPEIMCLSEIIKAHSEITKEMVTDPTTRDNSWFQQPCFNSSNILTKIPNRRGAGYKTESLKQAYYQLPENFHCRVSELYQGGTFIIRKNLETLVRTRTGIQNYILTELSHSMLRNSMKFVIKNTSKHEGENVKYPNCIPLNHPKPPKFSHSNTLSLYQKSKSGSKAFRRILDKNINFIDNRRVTSWRKALNTEDISEEQIRNTFKSLNDPNLSADYNDTLVRFFSRKTTFNYQNHKVYPIQATRPEWAHRLGCWSCETYLSTFQLETPLHALVECPIISQVRNEVTTRCGLSRLPQLTTHTHLLWGQYLAMPSNKNCTFLGNILNNVVSAEFLKARNYKKIDQNVLDRKVKDYFLALIDAKPNGKIFKEINGKGLGVYFQNPRPPEPASPQLNISLQRVLTGAD